VTGSTDCLSAVILPWIGKAEYLAKCGSQRAAIPGYVSRRLACVVAGERHAGRHWATPGDRMRLIWEQEAAGSPPTSEDRPPKRAARHRVYGTAGARRRRHARALVAGSVCEVRCRAVRMMIVWPGWAGSDCAAMLDVGLRTSEAE
jgi:hypothetical protein